MRWYLRFNEIECSDSFGILLLYFHLLIHPWTRKFGLRPYFFFNRSEEIIGMLMHWYCFNRIVFFFVFFFYILFFLEFYCFILGRNFRLHPYFFYNRIEIIGLLMYWYCFNKIMFLYHFDTLLFVILLLYFHSLFNPREILHFSFLLKFYEEFRNRSENLFTKYYVYFTKYYV